MGGINKELRHRCSCFNSCFNCNKIFDNRYEGSLANGYLLCDECYQKYVEFLKQKMNNDDGR